jgi:hypothetical protein
VIETFKNHFIFKILLFNLSFWKEKIAYINKKADHKTLLVFVLKMSMKQSILSLWANEMTMINEVKLVKQFEPVKGYTPKAILKQVERSLEKLTRLE